MSLGELFSFLSASRNSDVIDSDQFFREDEKNDERVGRIVALINAKQDWSEFEWEVQDLPQNLELSDSEEGVDVGDVTETHVEEPSHVEEPAVVARRGKRKINDPGVEARKKQLVCQRVAEHSSSISGQMKTFIEVLFTSLKEVVQKDIQKHFDKEMAQLKEVESKIPGPSDTMGKERASEILLSPSAAKEKGKGKATETGVPPTVRRSPRPRKDIETDDMLDFLKNLSQSSKNKDMGTQEYLQEAVGNLSQASHVRGFDPSQKSSLEEAVEISTPLSSFKPADYKTLSLKDTDLPEDRVNDIDHSLVFVPEDSWVKLRKWCSTSKQHLKIGPSRTSLGRWNQSKVAFMSCLFSNQMKNSYIDFKKDRKGFKVQGLLHQYGIEVFDCGGMKHNKDLEPFSHLIPRIVKAVQSSKSKLIVKPYDVTYAPMPFLNKTCSDCMDLSLVNDDNIREDRLKIAYDLWEAANDPIIISRMSQFIPPKTTTDPVVTIL
ncbi:hypothetical protein Bca52824_066499 [Brassica carinata]|uniref:Uncharacterized protein n=1 Tax=Brassica carinata TaxID=52824 RepID=A0A8X7QRA1_BRACI|nr:hypothetical protein Bca52824_066499 [Brassica carinata]